MIRFAATLKLAAGLAMAASLSACGFTPLHAPSANSALGSALSEQGLHGNVKITFMQNRQYTQNIARAEMYLRQALITRLGEPDGAARYELTLGPKFTREAVGVTTDYIDSRYDLRLSINFTFDDLQTSVADGDKLFITDLEAITTFGAPSNPYALNAAQDLAEENLAREAADRLILRLSQYLKTGS